MTDEHDDAIERDAIETAHAMDHARAAWEPVIRTLGESIRYTWDALRDTLNELLVDMLIPTNERSARKTANARRNRLRRKRNRRRRRRG